MTTTTDEAAAMHQHRIKDTQRRMRNILRAHPASTWTLKESLIVLAGLSAIVRGRPHPFCDAVAKPDDAGQRKLHTVFAEMNALLDVFPSPSWSPDDAQAVLDALSRRFYLHKTQEDIIELD